LHVGGCQWRRGKISISLFAVAGCELRGTAAGSRAVNAGWCKSTVAHVLHVEQVGGSRGAKGRRRCWTCGRSRHMERAAGLK
jgi:hypothetical protein